jgi:hypothetical protein
MIENHYGFRFGHYLFLSRLASYLDQHLLRQQLVVGVDHIRVRVP